MHSRIKALISLFSIISIFISLQASASGFDFTSDEYKQHSIDYNQDGIQDVLFEGPSVFIPLHIDMLVPLIFPTDSAVWIQNPDNTHTLIYPANQAQILAATKHPTNHEFFFQDITGDGVIDLIAKSTTANQSSFYYTGGPSDTAETISISPSDFNLSAAQLAQSNWTFLDEDGDGILDIQIELNGKIEGIAYGGLGSLQHLAIDHTSKPAMPAELAGTLPGQASVSPTGSTKYPG